MSAARGPRRNTAPDKALRQALKPTSAPRRRNVSGPVPSGPTSRTRPRSGTRPQPTTPRLHARVTAGGSVAAPWLRSNTRRLRAVTLGTAIVFTAMFAKMSMLQLRSPEAVSQANRQRIRATTLAAERGDIVDRSGVPLAISIREWRLVADPIKIQKENRVNEVANTLGSRLGVDPLVIKKRLELKRHYAIVARGLDQAKADVFRTRRGRIDYVELEEEPRRLYPAGDLARGVLGTVRRIDQVGQSGLELQFENELRGREGEMRVERDMNGRQIPNSLGVVRPAKRGETYQTTLDRSLQYQLEGVVANAMAVTGSERAVVVVSLPGSGEIVAIVNMTVDDQGNVINMGNNCAMVCAFELGSVMKPATIGAALEEGRITADSTFSVGDKLTLWDKTFKDDAPHPTMVWTPGQILTESSNIGTIKIATKLGKQKLYAYLRSLGFGSRSAVAFPGESVGILPKPAKWSGTSIGTIPIGQGVASTATQMLELYNTIANGGVRVPLKLVRAKVDSNGKTIPYETEKSTRVFSEKTANELTSMLTNVVRRGTGTAASISGYSVAGKTGTAQKPENKGYSKTKYLATFAGFFPAERPVLSAIVILDEPKTSIYGGHIAAPLFSEIGRIAAATYRVAPSPGQQVDPDARVSNAEGSLAWHRALLRRGALSTGPATSFEIQQAKAGTVTVYGESFADDRDGAATSSMNNSAAGTQIETNPGQNGSVVSSPPTTAPAGGVVYLPNGESVAAGVSVVPATIAPGLSALEVPVRYGIPDLSQQTLQPRVRPRALATPMTLRAGATEHGGSTSTSTTVPQSSANAATSNGTKPKAKTTPQSKSKPKTGERSSTTQQRVE